MNITRTVAPLLTAGLLTLAGAVAAQDVKLPETTPALERGKANYEKFCSACHGANGVGTDKGPPFLHRVYHPGHHGDGAFFRAAKQGVRAHHWPFGDMAPVDDVTETEVQTIVDYVRALQRANGIF